VQQTLEEAMSTIFGTEIAVSGAGRTDTGVHAKEFYAHFDIDAEYSIEELKKKTWKMNGFLSKDIYIYKIIPVRDDAHARFDAISRTYNYIITTRKDPFHSDEAWLLHDTLDLDLMNEGAKLLMEYTDFTSFSKLHSDVKTNNCNVMEAQWETKDHFLVFSIRADRFLRNMVRAIVGTLVDLGKGRISLDDLKNIIEAKDRSGAGMSVPAHGLYLIDIEYPDDIWIKAGKQ
jgi:tRNA pseudouridine38-40 synthase